MLTSIFLGFLRNYVIFCGLSSSNLLLICCIDYNVYRKSHLTREEEKKRNHSSRERIKSKLRNSIKPLDDKNLVCDELL